MDAPGQDTRGSFLKLVDTIAWEIGEFRQEMVQTDRTAGGRSPGSSGHLNLHRDMGNASLEKRETKTFLRDSGYESYSHKLSILDKLLHTHAIWLQLGLSESETLDILQSQPPGTFLVRKSMKLQRKVISLRLPKESETCLKEYAIKESSYTFSVEGSGISFADLFRLIAFHCISRDVLPFTLKLPPAITQAKTESELEDIAHLGLSFWQSPVHNRPPPAPPKPLPCDSRGPPRQQPAARTNGVQSLHTRTPSELECSQGNGALCFINPLFLEVHPQDSASKRQILRAAPAVKNGGGVERRARSPPPPRPPPPALLQSPQLCRAVKQETAAASMPEIVSCPQLNGSSSVGSHHPPPAAAAKAPAPIPPPRRKKSQLSLQPPPQPTVYIEWEIGAPKLALELLQSCPSAPLAVRPDMASSPGQQAPPQQQQPPPTGQRLSDLSISTSSSDSLERTIPFYDYEGDSFESDPESSMAPPLKPRKKRSSSFGFPKMVKTQLRKMSGVFSSLMTPEKKMVKRIAELSRDKRTYLGSLVQDYISFLRENRECHVSVTDMLQTIRQFMTQVKNYLSQSSELDPPIETFIPEDQIDAVLEKAMHKCILKPLKCHIDAMLKEFHTADGSWRQLKENLQLVRQRNPQELGVFAPVPDFVDVEKIKVKLMTMQKMYSPEKKVMLLLRVCKLIYTCMENNSGRMYGADDFLPMLTYVIAQCDMLELETEIEYMMELLDPVLLHGEGGYYLTSAYGALSLIKNFQEEQAARLLSSEARNTLRQWHKRRTSNRTIPSVDDFQKDESDALVNKETFISAAQNYLRVALQEVESGCTGKTLIVKPYTTTEEVCQICAERFKVQDPECYGLFLYIDETWQQLTEDTYPQKIKAELHSRPQPQVFHFVYKRINSTFAGIFNYEDNDADFSHLAS